MATKTPLRTYDPAEPGFFQDPYRQLEALREQSAVSRTADGTYLLLRYDEAQAYLHADNTSVMMKSVAGIENSESLWQPAAQSVINQDPPNHSRLRKLVMKAFTAQAIAALRPMIEREAEELIAAFRTTNGGDFVEQIAFPMPYAVICNMLGVQRTADFDVKEACLTVTGAIVDLEHSPETVAAARDAYEHMAAYFLDLIAEKRRRPDDGLLSALIAAEEEGSRLTTEELVDMLALVFIGGFDSVISMLGSGLLLLLRNPDQLALWRDNPAIGSTAVEEIVRLEPPVLFGGRRITMTDVEVAGTPIPKGSVMLVCAASANRDPRFWGETAHQLRLDRREASRSLSFGGGIHRCLGNTLARTQGDMLLGSLIRQFPGLKLLEDEPVWKRGTHQRSLQALQISLGL